MSARLLDGQVIADLPGFEPAWPLRRTISAADTGTGTLHLDKSTPENWETAILEGGSTLLCYDDADPSLPILWAGWVVSAPRDYASNDVPINLVTFEDMFDWAFVGDVTYGTTWHAHDIIHNLLGMFTAATGIPVDEVYRPGTGGMPTEAIVMQNTDNATVKTRFDQVCGQLGGEYTIEWKWINGGQGVRPVLIHDDRVGQAAPVGADPLVTFESPGTLISLTQGRSYDRAGAANKITPYSSGQGPSTPYGTPVTAPADGRPVLEVRYQPAPNLSPAGLQQYAQQALAVWGPGARPVTLVASTERAEGRRLGVDWHLGDDIGWNVAASYQNEQGATVPVLAFPNALTGVGRAIAYELDGDAHTVTPILADKTVYQGS